MVQCRQDETAHLRVLLYIRTSVHVASLCDHLRVLVELIEREARVLHVVGVGCSTIKGVGGLNI